MSITNVSNLNFKKNKYIMVNLSINKFMQKSHEDINTFKHIIVQLLIMMLIEEGSKNYGILFPLNDTLLKCHAHIWVHN
jgi:hypothetical protein